LRILPYEMNLNRRLAMNVIKSTVQQLILLSILLSLFLAAFAGSVSAAQFCVRTAAQLQANLNTAAGN